METAAYSNFYDGWNEQAAYPDHQHQHQEVGAPMEPEAVRDFIYKLFHPDAGAVPIIHPEFKALGRLWIPWPFVVRTSGLERYLTNHPHAPSLCVLFQNGRCNSRDKCNQIHVDVGFAGLISRALHLNAVSNCCRSHGDLGSASNDIFSALKTDTIEIRMPGMQSLNVSTERIAATFFWNRFVKEKRRVLFFSPDRVCNLHQQNQCKYGVECKNVHVCRQFWSEVTSAINGALPRGVKTPLETQIQHLRPPVSMPNAMALNGALEMDRLGGAPFNQVAPEPIPPKPKARASCALAIVDPTSGEEVSVKKAEEPEVAPEVKLQESAPVMDTAPGPVGPPLKRGPSIPNSPLSPGVNLAPFAAAGRSSLFMSFPTIFSCTVDEQFSPVSTAANTLPSSPVGSLAQYAPSEECTAGETTPCASPLVATATPWSPFGAKKPTLTVAVPETDSNSQASSSDGSPVDTPGPLESPRSPGTKLAFPSRLSPVGPVSPVTPMTPSTPDELADEWLRKSEAWRGKFKETPRNGLLGVHVTGVPEGQKGFGMGRGWSAF